jgi:hypothetical protein
LKKKQDLNSKVLQEIKEHALNIYKNSVFPNDIESDLYVSLAWTTAVLDINAKYDFNLGYYKERGLVEPED